MMTRREANIGLVSSAAMVMAGNVASAQQQAIDLLPPRSQGGKPLIEALRLRRSIRQYAPRQLPPQMLSDLSVGRLRHQSPRERRPNRALLAACHGDRRLRGDG